jgi:hypothetical protein
LWWAACFNHRQIASDVTTPNQMGWRETATPPKQHRANFTAEFRAAARSGTGGALAGNFGAWLLAPRSQVRKIIPATATPEILALRAHQVRIDALPAKPSDKQQTPTRIQKKLRPLIRKSRSARELRV